VSELFLSFTVTGTPRPKQSFRYSKSGGYTSQCVKDWQEAVGWEAKQQMMGKTPHSGPVAVELLFVLLESKTPKDLDNLSKGVLDSMKQIVYVDDNQVMRLLVEKRYSKDKKIVPPGVHIIVRNLPE
jgi:Holliday junction resolvase RusA-like endonuclease